MTAEEYLQRIKTIDLIIINKRNERQYWVEIADSLGEFSTSERVQASRNLHKKQEAINNYIDIDRKIEALQKEREGIIKTIERLPPIDYDVIYKIYVRGCTLKEIAYSYKMSYSWAKNARTKALNRLQSILDG